MNAEEFTSDSDKLEMVEEVISEKGSGKLIFTGANFLYTSFCESAILKIYKIFRSSGDEMAYDVIIVGGGPAGYAAALYCARAGMDCLLMEALTPGGQMGTTDVIDNYPGFEEGVNGFDLAMNMQKQAERFGAKTAYEKVTEINLLDDPKVVMTEGGGEYSASAVILALGASPRELGLPNERALRGRGVSYCATCDGAFYKGKSVVVVGGGDTAAADAVFLSKLCEKVYLVHRRDTLRASKAYLRPLESCENIEFVWDSVVEEIHADQKVNGVFLRNIKTKETKSVPCDGVFVAVGTIPNTSLVQGQVELDKMGYILAGEDTKTSIPGVFAAGDVRKKPLRQVVTATADGAVASYMVEEYLSQK